MWIDFVWFSGTVNLYHAVWVPGLERACECLKDVCCGAGSYHCHSKKLWSCLINIQCLFGFHIHTRWDHTSDKWNYNPCKWPYKWAIGTKTHICRWISGRGPHCSTIPCRVLRWAHLSKFFKIRRSTRPRRLLPGLGWPTPPSLDDPLVCLVTFEMSLKADLPPISLPIVPFLGSSNAIQGEDSARISISSSES